MYKAFLWVAALTVISWMSGHAVEYNGWTCNASAGPCEDEARSCDNCPLVPRDPIYKTHCRLRCRSAHCSFTKRRIVRHQGSYCPCSCIDCGPPRYYPWEIRP